MANSLDPDQTAPGSTLFAQTCLKTWDHYSIPTQPQYPVFLALWTSDPRVSFETC